MKLLLFLIASCYSNFSFATNIIYHPSGYDPIILLWLVIFIFISRSFSIVKKIGFPLVVGEIVSGIILGELDHFGFHLFQLAENNAVMLFLAELGAIILMFEIGLETQFSELRHNFKTGITVAVSGTIFTFAAGFLISMYLINGANLSLNLLMGVILAATATGISAKTFKDLGILHTKEVKIVLVSSIIDELVSIIVFGIISAFVIEATLSFTNLSLSIIKVACFFIFAAIFGNWITPLVTKLSIKIHSGINMKIGVLLIICFLFSWVAHELGLATVIGAFIAGLILDQMYFTSFSKSNFFIQLQLIKSQVKDKQLKHELTNLIENQEKKSLEELLKPLSHMFVPVFFIYIGMLLNIHQLIHPTTLVLTIALLIASCSGRIISGYFVKGKHLNKLIIGLGMTPIGEAGLIFAMFGRVTGILNDSIFSAVVSALVIVAVLTPILINGAIKLGGIHHHD